MTIGYVFLSLSFVKQAFPDDCCFLFASVLLSFSIFLCLFPPFYKHHLNTLIESTRISVPDQRCVVEFDAPAVLLAEKSDWFYSMVLRLGWCRMR